MFEEEIHKIEQSSTFMNKQLVPILGSFFGCLIEVGFTRKEALILTKEYMRGTLDIPPSKEKD